MSSHQHTHKQYFKKDIPCRGFKTRKYSRSSPPSRPGANPSEKVKVSKTNFMELEYKDLDRLLLMIKLYKDNFTKYHGKKIPFSITPPPSFRAKSPNKVGAVNSCWARYLGLQGSMCHSRSLRSNLY